MTAITDKGDAQKVTPPVTTSTGTGDDSTKSAGIITPEPVKDGDKQNQYTTEELLKLYSESSKEAKRLYALTKEQEAKLKEFENAIEQMSNKYQEVEPWLKALENPDFVRYISNYDPQKGTADVKPDSTNYGLGDNFEDFEPRDMWNPTTPSGKFFADAVAKQVKDILNQELSVRDEQAKEEKLRERAAVEIERQIDDFVKDNPHIKREDVEAALEAAKSRPLTVADIYYTINRDKINEEIRRSTLEEVQNKRLKTVATPYPLAVAASDGDDDKAPPDRMYDMLARNLNVMGITPEAI